MEATEHLEELRSHHDVYMEHVRQAVEMMDAMPLSETALLQIRLCVVHIALNFYVS